MASSEALVSELRSMWEVAYTSHMCGLFRLAFGHNRPNGPRTLPDFEVDRLETALASDASSPDPLVADIHVRLLRGLCNDDAIS